MSASRRFFLKGVIAGAGIALDGLPATAQTSNEADSKLALPSSTNYEAQVEAANPDFSRVPGLYPGSPREDFSPRLVLDAGSTYRNLALRRPAFHSSSYDYNLTAQLITDGIKHTHLPDWIATSISSSGQLSKQDRELFLDHNVSSSVEVTGESPWVQIQLGGGQGLPLIDRIDLLVIIRTHIDRNGLSFTIQASDDGRAWKKIGSVTGPQSASLEGYPPNFAKPGQLFKPSIAITPSAQSRYYRVECSVSDPLSSSLQCQFAEVALYRNNQRVEIGGPYSFTSAWMSAGSAEEWVYVDLGSRCDFDRVSLYWIARPAEGSLQVSDDAHNWRDIKALVTSSELNDDIKLSPSVTGRYVRVLMKRPTSPNGYILSELEVYGKGGVIAQPKSASPANQDGRLDLAGGSWRVQRSSQLAANTTGASLSKSGYKDDEWIVATVPGTVLTSFLNAGALPDPNYGENQLYISDSFFYADFWYRTEFTAPATATQQITWLNLDGINWNADVFLNGEKLGRIEGGFQRARFNVTGKITPGQTNALAILVEKNATPGSAKQKTYLKPGQNGGALGADNPTYHASVGWDWIPTIRGRNTGIWDEVYLTTTGPVTLEDHFVQTTLPLPDTSHADISVEVNLVNHHTKPIAGTLHGRFGDTTFTQRLPLQASSTKKLRLDPSTTPALRLQNPKLWWPVGYGDPHLYEVELSFEPEGHNHKPSDTKKFLAGVRQMSSTEDNNTLKLYINGRRFIARGGNWGFGESMLRYRAREYDAAVRYHREMNFTMIRNWVGQIGDEEFYEACDRHGVIVWQDFWLANPSDGPDPDNDDLFLRNAKDFLLRIRNHASIGLYCGRNEGYPPKTIEQGLRSLLAQLHPGIHYIPSSADDVVSGHGPYRAMPLTFYFGPGANDKLHSEQGMPNIPTLESVRAMMPAKDLWPQGLAWGLHDFCLQGAQGGDTFHSMINEGYGGADNVEQWISLAQFVNYEGYRAMFEAQSKYRMGLLLWMSHPCWPSFVWQTYDYYLEPTAAYFGCKKASEPLHIQWNRNTENIEVVNYSGGNTHNLTASVELLNLDGTKLWDKSITLDSAEDSVATPIAMQYSASITPVHFLRLSLTQGGNLISSNFYLRGVEEGDYRAIRQLPTVRVEATTTAQQQSDRWHLTTALHNPSSTPALMVRLQVVRETSGDRILPAIYSDNYIALMPGEQRTITTELNHADTRGEKPKILIGGFNTSST
jgi:hypothetical protein